MGCPVVNGFKTIRFPLSFVLANPRLALNGENGTAKVDCVRKRNAIPILSISHKLHKTGERRETLRGMAFFWLPQFAYLDQGRHSGN